MNPSLTDRLNQILPKVTSEAFLSSAGIGNEIACYIFDCDSGELDTPRREEMTC